MDLTKQPPRRPSNMNLAGIVALGRIADKARAHNAEKLGVFDYGEDSRLDREVLGFINMTPDEFARAAEELDDRALEKLALEKAQKSQAEIDEFNREQLEREPQDELHIRLLRERQEKYTPGRSDLKTIIASIELDDWGAFRELDLTAGPPRTAYLRTVFGAVGVARMADKGRASKSGKLGDYYYGEDSGVDEKILEFLGVGADEFAQAAYENPNDTELGEWLAEHSSVTQAEITAFNGRMTSLGRFGRSHEYFVKRREQICPDCPAIETWFDLNDYDDQKSFGLIDLNRRPPRSPYDVSGGGVYGLARMIDKGRAHIGGTLGDYWYGEDSGADRMVLAFLKMKADAFTELLGECATDEAVVERLGDELGDEGKVEAFNQKALAAGPEEEGAKAFFQSRVARLDPQRTDLCTWYGLMLLEDRISFARLKAGV